jgi:hypothetical protein
MMHRRVAVIAERQVAEADGGRHAEISIKAQATAAQRIAASATAIASRCMAENRSSDGASVTSSRAWT